MPSGGARMTPSDVVSGRVREIRHKRAMTVAQLADRLADLGMPGLTEQALYNLEAGRPDRRGHRRRAVSRSEEHTSELQSRRDLVCRLLLEKKKKKKRTGKVEKQKKKKK